MIAQKAVVKIGNLTIDGYMLPDGSFGMSQTQVFLWAVPDYESNQASKRYIQISSSKLSKTLYPSGFVVYQNIKIREQNEKVNIVLLNPVCQFLTICLALGMQEAAKLLNLLSGLSLQQLFCDAFNIDFDKQDRQAWLVERQEGKEARRTLTDCLKDHIDKNNIPEDKNK